jgi:hypothetical protein
VRIRAIAGGLIAVAALGLSTVVAGGASVSSASAVSMVSAADAIGPNPKGHVDRVITDSRITESSGLTPSLLHPDVFWTHNDSGNPPRIYAIGKDGNTVAALTLEGEPDVDWEAITSLRGPATSLAPGAPLIAVGDIGDNDADHASVRISIVREPQKLESAFVQPIRDLRLIYPGGPRDAEALLTDPRTGQFYIVSKTLFGSALYSVPKSIWPGDGRTGISPVTQVKLVARMTASLITDGAFRPDGRMVLRGYDQVFIVDKPSNVKNGRLKTLTSAMLPLQDQGESLALIDGGKEALIGSEGVREPVYRITLPIVPADKAASLASPTAAAENTAGGGHTAGTSSTHTFSGIGGRRLWTGVAGAAIILIALISVLALVRTRPRSYR